MKIHRTKVGCVSKDTTHEQRSTEVGNTLENLSQGENHSAEEVHAHGSSGGTDPDLKHRRINFPPASAGVWSSLDEALYKALNKELGPKRFSERLKECGNIMYKICAERFGTKEPVIKVAQKKNRRQRMMDELRHRKKLLRKQINQPGCTEAERLGSWSFGKT